MRDFPNNASLSDAQQWIADMRKERRIECKVRTASQKDAAAIARIQHEAWIATYPNEHEGISAQDVEIFLGERSKREEKWRNIIEQSSTSYKIFIAEEDGEIRGFCKVEKNEHEHHISALYLDPAYRKNGIGGALIKQAIAYLGEEMSITLEVATQNENAKSFYKHYGFEEAGGRDLPRRINGKKMHLTFMRRPGADHVFQEQEEA